MLIPKTDDGRVLFAIPWFGRLLVGTTEDEISPDAPLELEAGEVDYLLHYLNQYLSRPVTRDQVLSGTAGARPLVTSSADSSGSTSTKSLARDHEVELDQSSGLISILGGKWTTYRAMAEDAIDAVQTRLGGEGTYCTTLNRRLAGSENYTPDHWKTLVSRFSIAEATARHLAEKFGTRADRVLALATADSHLATPIVSGAAPILAEVAYSARNEMAITLDDVLARRTGIEPWSWKDAIAAAPAVAAVLANELDWSAAQQSEAVAAYQSRIQQRMSLAGISV
jgi:glycerol-3-phosphate dehydrogenase